MRVLDILRPPLVAIDVGTAATRVCWGSANAVEHPSVVSVEAHGSFIARRVMRSGVVADVAGVANVIGTLLGQRRQVWRRRPAAVVCAPTDISPGERDALVEAVTTGGASVVTVVAEPLAAAIGAGVDLSSEYATAIVDIGDGVTDLAVFKNASMVLCDAKRIGCGTLRAAIHDWLELKTAGEELREDTVDEIVRSYCRLDSRSSVVTSPPDSSVFAARDDLQALLEPVIEAIAAFVATTLRCLPDAVATEVIENGLYVTGGGAKLRRLVRGIEDRVSVHVNSPRDPLHAVIRGATQMLRYAQFLGAQRTSTG
jgi:rod shape-determining protein MreB and related proteins